MTTVHAPVAGSASASPARDDVMAALTTVDDPEYPGISIVDLGLFESCQVGDHGAVRVALVPTFSGCPALAMIADDVRRAVEAVPGVSAVEVTWLRAPAWTTDRVTDRGRAALADRFTVAVRIGDGTTACPRCGGTMDDQSLFGPSRCRSVAVCRSCRETVEVLRA